MTMSRRTATAFCAAAWLGTTRRVAAKEPEKVELHFTHYAERQHPAHRAAMEFARNVENRTGGTVRVYVHPAGTHGSPPEQLDKVHQGALHMGLPTHAQLDRIVPAIGAMVLPFVFDDVAHAHRTLDGPAFQWLIDQLAPHGLVPLSNWEWGFRHMTNNRMPITVPTDLAGLTVRVPPEMQLEAMMMAMGAKPTRIGFNVLYKALEDGKVDAQENPVGIIFHNKFYIPHRYVSLTQHCYHSMVHVVNANAWNALGPKQRMIVKEESVLAGAQMRREVTREEELQLFALKTTSTRINKPDPKAFRGAMQPAYDKIATYAGAENVRMFLAMAQAARLPQSGGTVPR